MLTEHSGCNCSAFQRKPIPWVWLSSARHAGKQAWYILGMSQAFLSFGPKLTTLTTSRDEEGNCIGANYIDYLLPTAWETPGFELHEVVTPCPHHPIGAKGVAESPHVGSIPTFTAAVVDAFAHVGVTHLDMPHTSFRVWKSLKEHNLAL